MNNEQKIKEIESTIDELKKQIADLKKTEFEFCHNGNFITASGDVLSDSGSYILVNRGRVFPSKKLASHFDSIINENYKIAQAVAFLDPEFNQFEYDGDLYRLFINVEDQSFDAASCLSDMPDIGVVYFPLSMENQIVKWANDGTLKLDKSSWVGGK